MARGGDAERCWRAVGMNAASLVWFAGAALGLGALAAAFPQAFRWLALAGAAYVAWLGLASILSAGRRDANEPTAAPLRSGAFREGLAVQLSNPKAMLFFWAARPWPSGWRNPASAAPSTSRSGYCSSPPPYSSCCVADFAQPPFPPRVF